MGLSGRGAFRAGIAVAGLASFLIVWTSIVRDDGQAVGYFCVIMATIVGAFAVALRPEGMARTMLGAAFMQATVGSLVATAPVTAEMPDGVMMAVLYSGFFTLMWLGSAAFFRAASKQDRAVEA